MSKEKQRCGANVEKIIIDEFVPSNELEKEYLEAFDRIARLPKSYRNPNNTEHCYMIDMDIVEKALHRLEAIDNANPSEALECVDILKEDGCITTLYQGKALETIRQALLKAQEQEEMIVELCEYYGLDNLYPYDDLEEIEMALKNARDISMQQELELLGKLNKQEKVLEIIKKKVFPLYNHTMIINHYKEYISYSSAFYQFYEDVYDAEKYLLSKEEFDLLKRYFGNENI